MKKAIIGLFVLIAAFVLPFEISAQQTHHAKHHGINARQRHQQNRIANGIKSGRLSARESSKLERREARTNRLERKYRKSGNGLSHHEKRILNRKLNKNSRAIYHKKHNGHAYSKNGRPIKNPNGPKKVNHDVWKKQ